MERKGFDRNTFSYGSPGHSKNKLSSGLSYDHQKITQITQALRDSEVDIEIEDSDEDQGIKGSPQKQVQLSRNLSSRKASKADRIHRASNDNMPTQSARPVPLIILDPRTKKFQVSQEGLNLLRSIQGRVGIAAIAGKYRSGKSLLMNLLVDETNQRQGFKVSARAQACTQGLWVWGQPIVNQKTKTTILLVDSEGSGAVDKNETHDAKIFSLVVLVSSLFIFNSFGVIDQKAIESLSLAAKLSRNIHFAQDNEKAPPEEDRLAQIAPRFIWLLRDFFLELRDEFDNPITQNQYLEKCLSHEGGVALTEKTKQIRISLLKIFKDRQCFTFPRPVEDEEDLQKLSSIPLSKMRSQFQEKIHLLSERVKGCPSKQINGTYLTGPIIAGLISGYARSLNEGIVPNLTSEWDHIRQEQTKEAFAEVEKKVTTDFKTLKQSIEPDAPLEEAEIYEELLKIQQINMKFMHKQFMKLDLGPHSVEQSLFSMNIKKIDNLFKREQLAVLELNQKYTKKLNTQLAINGYAPIEEAIVKRKYDDEEKESQFREDLQGMVRKYKKESRGPSKLPVFADLLTDKLTKIIETVQRMSNKRIKEAEGKLQVLKEETGDQIEALNQQVQNLEKENQSLRNNRVKLRAELTAANQDVELEKEDRLALKERTQKMEGYIRDLKKQIEELRRQNEEEESDVEDSGQRKRSTVIKPPKNPGKKTQGCNSCTIF